MLKYSEQEITENANRVLRRLRLDGDNITQTQVAEAIGMLLSSYNRIESGKQKLYLLDMVRIANFYEISLSHLAELIQQSPAELDQVKRLQIELDSALKEIAYLKTEFERVKQTLPS